MAPGTSNNPLKADCSCIIDYRPYTIHRAPKANIGESVAENQTDGLAGNGSQFVHDCVYTGANQRRRFDFCLVKSYCDRSAGSRYHVNVGLHLGGRLDSFVAFVSRKTVSEIRWASLTSHRLRNRNVCLIIVQTWLVGMVYYGGSTSCDLE